MGSRVDWRLISHQITQALQQQADRERREAENQRRCAANPPRVPRQEPVIATRRPWEM